MADTNIPLMIIEFINQYKEIISVIVALTAIIGIYLKYYSLQREKKEDLYYKAQKEMELLVGSLYSKSRNDVKRIFFLKGSPGYYISAEKRVKEYFEFWDNVKTNKYLAPQYLENALDIYWKNKSNNIRAEADTEYEQSEKNLVENIELRYQELSAILKNK